MPSKPRNFLVKIVTVALFGLLILSFAVWGIGDVFRGATGSTTIIEAGPVEIDQRAYERELARSVNQLSAQFGGQIDRRQLLSFGIGDQVLAQMVGRAVLDAEIQELGLVATDTLVADVLTDASAFGDGQGGFNRAAFEQYLFRIQQSEEEYLANLRGQILRSNLTGALTGGLATPEVLARRLFDYREETRIAQYLRLDYAAFAGEVPEPKESELAAYYEENKASFMAPERRALTYLYIDPEVLVEEIAVSEEAIAEAYEARREELSTPERRHLEQLLFDDQAAAQAAAERVASGADFAALAEELKLGAPIDLGTLARNELEQASPALAEAAFGATAGEVAGPVESPLGWHLVKVLAVEPGKEPTLDELRETLKHDLARADAVEAVISLANQLDDALAGGATLEEAGARLGLEADKVPAVDRQGNDVNGQPLADLPPGDSFLQSAFELGAGEVSLLRETEDGGYFVVRIDDITASAARPLEEVREQLVERWTDARAKEMARAKAEQLADRLAGAATMETVAAAEDLELKTSEPLLRDSGGPAADPARSLPPALFSADLGDSVIAEANDYLLLAKLTEIVPADPGEGNAFAELNERLADARRDDLFVLLLDSLRRRHDATVNQRLVDETLARF